MTVNELSEKIEGQLEAYMDGQQTQPFANFIIQQFLQNYSDLAKVNAELCEIWSSVDHYSDMELLVTVY